MKYYFLLYIFCGSFLLYSREKKSTINWLKTVLPISIFNGCAGTYLLNIGSMFLLCQKNNLPFIGLENMCLREHLYNEILNSEDSNAYLAGVGACGISMLYYSYLFKKKWDQSEIHKQKKFVKSGAGVAIGCAFFANLSAKVLTRAYGCDNYGISTLSLITDLGIGYSTFVTTSGLMNLLK